MVEPGTVLQSWPGAGFEFEVDGGRPLDELTQALGEICDRTEDAALPAVVVVRPVSCRPEDRAWPGAVTISSVTRWERAVRRFERLNAVTLSVAEGMCGGPALDLLLTTDYRIATPDLCLLLPVNEGQFWPGMALYRLVHQIGGGRARRMVLWGHDVTATLALDCGLVDEVATDVHAAVEAALVLFGRVPGRELAVRRALLHEAASVDLESALGVHLAACDRELRRLDSLSSDAAEPLP